MNKYVFGFATAALFIVAVVAMSGESPAPASEVATTYELELKGSMQATLDVGGEPLMIEGRHDIVARIELQPYGDQLAVTIVRLDRGDVDVMGRRSLDAADVVQKSFFVRGDELVAPADSSLDAQRFMQLVAAELGFDLQAGDSWTAVEQGLLGEVESHYQREGSHVRRRRTAYRSLRVKAVEATVEGTDDAAFEDGRLLSLIGEETVRGDGVLAHSVRRLVRLGWTPPRTLAAASIPRRISEPIVSEEAERRIHDDRIDGLTAARLIEDLEAHPSGRIPDHNRWLWRASGLLRAKPELASRLVEVLRSPESTTGGRGLVLDLLAAAGHAEAQVAMREVVELEDVRRDTSYPVLFQRFALVKRPTSSTVEFLQNTRNTARDLATYTAATVSLGAAASRVVDGASIAQTLLADLSSETEPGHRRALIAALGNAAFEPAVPELARLVRSFDPKLRAATASAMRRLHGAPARSLAVQLTRDPVDLVQVRALHAVRKQGLREADIDRLDVDGTSELALPALVTLLEPHVETKPAARRLLAAVLDRRADPGLKARVRLILGTP